jgi:hypothetical protein
MAAVRMVPDEKGEPEITDLILKIFQIIFTDHSRLFRIEEYFY